MCLSILTKWEGESPGSSSISRLTSEAKNLLANCEVELEARDDSNIHSVLETLNIYAEKFPLHFIIDSKNELL